MMIFQNLKKIDDFSKFGKNDGFSKFEKNHDFSKKFWQKSSFLPNFENPN